MSPDDTFLIKYKSAGMSNLLIAKKLGITEAEVEQRWKDIQITYASVMAESYANLTNHFTVLCHQYQLLGESLKILGSALSNPVTKQDLRNLWQPTQDETIAAILANCIVLRTFIPPTPEESLEKTLQSN